MGPTWGHLGAFGGHLEAILGHFGAILGRFGAIFGPLGAILGVSSAILAYLGLFGKNLGPFWDDLGTMLGRFLDPFGIKKHAKTNVNTTKKQTRPTMLKRMLYILTLLQDLLAMNRKLQGAAVWPPAGRLQ